MTAPRGHVSLPLSVSNAYSLQVVSGVKLIKQIRSETVEYGNNGDSVQPFSALIKLTFN